MGTGPTEFWLTDDPNDSDRDKQSDKTPETPPDKPRPSRVEEPPPQPDSKGPYVVRAY
jgi:hypothetical protein